MRLDDAISNDVPLDRGPTTPSKDSEAAELLREGARGRRMGLFKAEVQVRNPAGGAFVEISPVVDTGAVYSMLPESLLCQELGLAPQDAKEFTLADGTKRTYGIGEARFRVEDVERTTPVIFEDDDMYLLGAVTLQSLGLIADTTHHRLIPAPELFLVGMTQSGLPGTMPNGGIIG